MSLELLKQKSAMLIQNLEMETETETEMEYGIKYQW